MWIWKKYVIFSKANPRSGDYCLINGMSVPAGIAMDLTSFPTDVIEIEKVPQDVADRIRRKGRVVYERKDP